MGLPMIQVLMIAARQISRPIADKIMRYSKDHPFLRKRVLIPLGRGLAHLTTRIRMKNLGLGSPTTLAPVSEATALEQASELMQQVVIFSYSVAVFAGYYFYTKQTAIDTVKSETFLAFKEDNVERLKKLEERLERIELLLSRETKYKNELKGLAPEAKSEKNGIRSEQQDGTNSFMNEKVTRVVLPGREQYIVLRKEDLVVIEPLENVLLRGATFLMRNRVFKSQSKETVDEIPTHR